MDSIPIIYEDDRIVVINKPAGLLVHHGDVSSNPNEPTVAAWLVNKYPSIKGVGEDPARPGIVHRLDRQTSGVLVIAKNQAAYEHLKKQFKNREAVKTYRAILEGILKDDRGLIDRPIGKARADVRLRMAGSRARGVLREALTYYKVLDRFASANCTYAELYPKTGRTHQIRVHAKAINHPVVGDLVYGALSRPGVTRHLLHAYSLEITLPSGERRTFNAPLPPDFLDFLSRVS